MEMDLDGPCGVTGLEGALDALLAPDWAMATTVKVYETPFANPVTTHEVDGLAGGTALVVQALPPGDEVTR